MSKTPRTDEAMFATAMNRTVVVHVRFAQQLETELADKDRQLAEARAEIENLQWRVSEERAKTEAALELNDKALALVNEARADADHWKSECNTLQRMAHEARAEIEMLKHQLEDESMRADGMTTAHAEACAKNYRQQELIEQIRSALGRIADELEPSEHDIRGCMFKACKWCDARAALSAAERGG